MRVRMSLTVVMMMFLGIGVIAGAAAGEPVTVLKGLDPVELTLGREVAGRAELARDLGHYRYQFATWRTGPASTPSRRTTPSSWAAHARGWGR